MRTFFVVNPNSANGLTGKRWAEIGAQIGKALGGDFGYAFTSHPMHAAELAREALRERYQCVVAVGGDGTLNEVVNGFFEGGKALNPEAAVAVLPRGTGGDFRKTFGWGLDLAGSLERLRGEGTRPFDVGVIEFVDHQGKPATRYFANVCSLGIGGLVDQKVNQGSKALGGKLSFMIGSLKALMSYQDCLVQFQADDGEPKEMPITALSVANGKYFGGGMMVAPDADPSDGIFDVTVWSGYGLSDFVLKQKGIYNGDHVKWPGTSRFRCKKLVAKSSREVLLDVDGEAPGRLPCTVRILPSAIRIKA